MRFVVTGEWRQNSLLRLILGAFLLYVALLWITNALLYFSQMSLWPSSVVAFYQGSDAAFTQPRSYKVLLEISHFHLFAMGILLLTMTHLVLFAPIAGSTKAWLVILSFGGALADEAGGWLIRFVHPAFAYLKIAGFVALQATLAAMVVVVGRVVVSPPVVSPPAETRSYGA
jgi:hypothetical protein